MCTPTRTLSSAVIVAEQADVLERPRDAEAGDLVRLSDFASCRHRRSAAVEADVARGRHVEPVIMLKNVVLPAPFGPISVTIEPRGMSKSTSLTAVRPPNRLVTPRERTRIDSSGSEPVSRFEGSAGAPGVDCTVTGLEPHRASRASANWGRSRPGRGARHRRREHIERCHRQNIAVVLYVSLIFDRWASDQHADWRIINAAGQPINPGSRHGFLLAELTLPEDTSALWSASCARGLTSKGCAST